MTKLCLAAVALILMSLPAHAITLKSCDRGKVVEYGNGSYYVYCYENLGKVLSEMKEKFPNSVITFAAYAPFRSTSGYYILVNELPKK